MRANQSFDLPEAIGVEEGFFVLPVLLFNELATVPATEAGQMEFCISGLNEFAREPLLADWARLCVRQGFLGGETARKQGRNQ